MVPAIPARHLKRGRAAGREDCTSDSNSLAGPVKAGCLPARSRVGRRQETIASLPAARRCWSREPFRRAPGGGKRGWLNYHN